MMTILGASGSGKSSFLRAGLLPRLARDSRHFQVLPIIRPERAALTGEHGFAAMLEAALKSRNITRNRADIRAAATAGAAAVRPLLAQLVAPLDAGDGTSAGPPTLVIAVDQAEELLTADNAEAAALLALLADLAKSDDPAVLVIFTVRSDSFEPLQSRSELAGTQPHHLVDLPPTPAGSYGDIIRGPARRMSAAGRKLTVEETLVDALLADIERGGTKDALPLLAFTLERLYRDYGADGDLQLSEYEKLGRIRGAIEAAVEQALTAADSNPAIPRDRAARLALLRRGLIPWLAGIDPETGTPRRRVARLSEVPAEARPLIELMVEQRLLATDIDKTTNERTIEPAHEALLRQWGALDGWLLEDSADLATIEALRRAATDWEANAHGPEYLVHTGARLASAEQSAASDKFATYLSSVDRAYLAAARESEAAAQRRARAARTRLTIAAAIAGVVLVAGLTAGWFIYSAGEAAKREAAANFATAQAEAALRAGRREDAVRSALAAWDIAPSTATRTAALTAAMAVSPNAIATFPVTERVADTAWLDPDHLVALSAKGTVTALDLAMRRTATPATIPAQPLPIAIHSRGDGEGIIAYADASLTDLSGGPIAAVPQPEFAAKAGATKFSADGKVVGFIGLAGDALVRDCRSLPCVDRAFTAPENTDIGALAGAIAIKPDGSAYAINWWPGYVAVYTDPKSVPAVVKFPEGTSNNGVATGMDWGADHLALNTDSGKVLLLDPAGAAAPVIIDGGTLTPALEWSPTAPLLALVCDNTSVCLYRQNGVRAATYSGHTGKIGSLHWNTDGTALASVAPGDPLRLWSVEDDPQVVAQRTTEAWTALTSLAIDRAKGLVVAGDEIGQLWVWTNDQPTPQKLTIPDQQHKIASVAVLSDGRIAAVYENSAVAVWSLDKPSPDKLVTLDNLSFSRVAALSGDIRAAVPLSDKTVLVLSGPDLHDARVPADNMPLDQWGLTAAPAANTAFVSLSDGTIRRRDLGAGGEGTTVFEAKTSACGAAPTTDNNGAKSLDVSADGKWLVTTRSDDRVIVHNLADPAKPLCLALPAPDSKTVAFSPDSTQLAILSATDRLYLFDLAHPETATILGAPAVPDNSPERIAAGTARTTSWLTWQDNRTLLVSTTAGTIESIILDPAAWRARVDTLGFTQ